MGELSGACADAGRPDRSALRRRHLSHRSGGDRGGGRVLFGVGRAALWRRPSCARLDKAEPYPTVNSLGLAVPDAAAEGGDVDLRAILGIYRHAVAPFEIEARDGLPGQAAIGAAPGSGFEAGGVQDARVLRVDGDVVDVLIPFEHAAPACAAIGGEVDAAIGRALAR